MGYDYFCSYCGKQQNQSTVLFDMQYLLTRDETKKFNILKFRMTMFELKTLLASGMAAENGYKRCRLTMAQIMQYIGNANNLNDADIASLTLDQINAYINADTQEQKSQQEEEDFGFKDFDYEDQAQEKEEEPAPVYEKPASIAALERKSTALVDVAMVKAILTRELLDFQTIFYKGDVYEFLIREENDIDNEGKPVLEGYSLKFEGSSLRVKARVCCKCGTKIFEHAGTAKHQAVAFIGSPKSGKTSTIVSLTHYAMHYMDNGFGGDGVWEGCKTIESVSSVEHLDKIERQIEDLNNYGKGIAPKKTDLKNREDAYSVTFRLSNKAEDNKRYLLTLIDLPGELCVQDGNVQWAKVQDLFPVALTCDAFVLCFDTQSLAGKADRSIDSDETNVTAKGPAELVAEVCKWADEFQKMRASHCGVATYVPTMVLFTKCEELEDPNAQTPKKNPMTPIDKMYMFSTEKQQIARNRMYQYVSEKFSTHGQLNKAYHAMMRCSPFGYNAPDEYLVERMRNAGKEVHIQKPTPKNIDCLMRWLLSVAGCIPTEASFETAGSARPYTLQNFCISRPQLRSQNPGLVNHKVYGTIDDIRESMARCALFENPGSFDQEFVKKHNSGMFVLSPLRANARRNINSNDR